MPPFLRVAGLSYPFNTSHYLHSHKSDLFFPLLSIINLNRNNAKTKQESQFDFKAPTASQVRFFAAHSFSLLAAACKYTMFFPSLYKLYLCMYFPQKVQCICIECFFSLSLACMYICAAVSHPTLCCKLGDLANLFNKQWNKCNKNTEQIHFADNGGNYSTRIPSKQLYQNFWKKQLLQHF